MHARARASDRLDIVHTLRRLQKRVDHHGLLDAVPGLELGQKLVEIMNVPWSLNLGQHEHVELIAHGGHDLKDVVQNPRAVERIDAGPKSRAAELIGARQLDEACPCRFLIRSWDCVL